MPSRKHPNSQVSTERCRSLSPHHRVPPESGRALPVSAGAREAVWCLLFLGLNPEHPGFESFTLSGCVTLSEALREFLFPIIGWRSQHPPPSKYQVPASSQLPSEHCCPAAFWQLWQPAPIPIATDIVPHWRSGCGDGERAAKERPDWGGFECQLRTGLCPEGMRSHGGA